MYIRPMDERDYEHVLEIAEKLKVVEKGVGWFDIDARRRSIPIDIRIQRGFVAEEAKNVLGFVTYTSEYGYPRIGWIGVDPDHHRKGIGAALLEELEKEVKLLGAKDLRVETPTKRLALGTSYEQTYNFYEKMGFKVEKIERGEASDRGKDMAVLKKVID